MFAIDLHTHRRDNARQNVAGYFFARTLNSYGSVPPCGALMRPLPMRCKSTGKAEPFFISALKQIILKMTYTEETCLQGNNSTRQATAAHETGLTKLFELLSEFLLFMPELSETRKHLEIMFFDAMASDYDPGESLTRDHISKMFWTKKELDSLIEYAEAIEAMSDYIHSMRQQIIKTAEGSKSNSGQ